MAALNSWVASCSCFKWSCWERWRRYLLASAVVIYGVFVLVMMPLFIYLMVEGAPEFTATFVAAFLVLLTLPISLANMLQHVFNYTNPDLQTYICRIILTIPVFSISSLLAIALVDYGVSPYMGALLQVYEAFALYMFYAFCVKFLYQTYGADTEEVLKKQKPPRHIFSCCFTCPVGKKFIDLCRAGVLQFLFFKPLLALIQMITEIFGVYGDTPFTLKYAFLYVSIGNFFTLGTALYALLSFYRGTRELLYPIKPVVKFVAVKSIVFMLFVQNIVISILVRVNAIPDQDELGSGQGENQTSWAKYGFVDAPSTFNSFLVTFEMLLAAIGYYFAFSHRPYRRNKDRVASVPVISAILQVLNLTDLLWDASSTVQALCDKPGTTGSGEELQEVQYHEAKNLLHSGSPGYQSANDSSETEFEQPTRMHGSPSPLDNVAVLTTYNGSVSDSVPLVDATEEHDL